MNHNISTTINTPVTASTAITKSMHDLARRYLTYLESTRSTPQGTWGCPDTDPRIYLYLQSYHIRFGHCT